MLWFLLVLLYFVDIDGSFPEIVCPSVRYCSRFYVLDQATCAPSGRQCRAPQPATALLLCFLCIAQCNIGAFRCLSHNIYFCDRLAGDRLERNSASFRALACVGLSVANLPFLSLFVLEAVAIPFGTKDGHVAFAYLEPHGLQWAALVAFVLFTLGIVASRLVRCDTLCVVLWIPCAIALFLVLLTFGAAVFIWFASEHGEFVGASLFVLAWKQDYVLYKVVRTTFTVLSVAESLFFYAFVSTATQSATLVSVSKLPRLQQLCCSTRLASALDSALRFGIVGCCPGIAQCGFPDAEDDYGSDSALFDDEDDDPRIRHSHYSRHAR